MTLVEIAAKVKGTIVVSVEGAEAQVGYTSDLLSDVMGHAGEGAVLITIQNHLNTIAVCTLVGISIIVLCHNRPVPPDMLEAANREGVALVTTSLSQFAASVALTELSPATREG